MVFGLLFVGFGIFPMLAAFDLGPLRQADINGPPWLAFAAGGVFVAAGLAVIAGPQRRLLNALLVLLVLAGMAALGNWIAFGAGERVCAGSFPLFGMHELSGLGCRIPFGMGALIVNAVLALFAVTSLQRALGGPPRLARLRRFTESLLLLSLAPVLLPVLLILFGRVGFGALHTRLRTGTWPRNEAFIARRQAAGSKRESGDAE